MKSQNSINRQALDIRSAFAISLIIPMFVGWGAWALASGATFRLSPSKSYLEIFGIGLMMLSAISAPIPYLFRWNLETKYFGAMLFPFACGSLLGIFPLLCILLLSSLPSTGRLLIAMLEVALIFWWCARFVKIYLDIHRDSRLFTLIYKEERDAVYYLQQGDKRVIEQELKFNPVPSAKIFVGALLAALSLAPFASAVSSFVGIPFVHIFLAVSMVPTALFFLGLATKMWIVFYLYPREIGAKTGKKVYVDLSSHPIKSGRLLP